jgi:putative aldouronate transport system substrate-binding protein
MQEWRFAMKKIYTVALITILITLGIQSAGCRKETGASGGGAYPTGTVSYPIETDVTLTYWVRMSDKVSPNFTSNADTPMGKGIVERTGINVGWIHPPSLAVAADEQFNLMVAAGDLPDIVERNLWRLYPGGPEKAIQDGVILRLNDIFAKYCPNLTSYLQAHPEIDKMIKTDSGSYYCFPFIRDDPGLLIYQGLLIRQDWLDELGLATPETIDEWHTVLTAFREKKGSPAPFTFEYTNTTYHETHAFSLAYNAPARFFVADDGRVHYGPVEDGRREYLRTFARWYEEGLIDPDLATLRTQQVSAKMVSGAAGASFGTLGSRMGAWLDAALPGNPNYNLVAAPYPVLKKGDKVKMTAIETPYNGNGATSITTKSKNPELAARLLDWGYSREGQMFYNFGIEGESYVMENGFPAYTGLIMKNPKGWSVDQSIASYARAASDGPLIQDIRYQEQLFAYQVQKDGVKLWTVEGAGKYVLPPISPSPEESQETARIMSEIKTYRDEMEIKFILGTEPLTDAVWDNYIATIRRMGINRALEIQNAALARYNSR